MKQGRMGEAAARYRPEGTTLLGFRVWGLGFRGLRSGVSHFALRISRLVVSGFRQDAVPRNEGCLVDSYWIKSY